MEAAISALLAIIAGLTAVPIGVFFIEVIAATMLKGRGAAPAASDAARPIVGVIVPAHNESKGLLPTIADIKAQLRAGDRLLVVADNCTDDTAAIATNAGAEVIARTDLEKIGKGYALEWGIRHLSADPPAIVIMIDADCRLADGTIDRLCMNCERTSRPVQGLDLMHAPDQSSINYQVAEFAWRVKNWVRPLGLSALGLPCQLMGTGMAFPWAIIYSAKLATNQITEDLELGLDLAMAGSPPIFCPSARVTSPFPTSAATAERQRQRWEHGHVGMILARAPRLVAWAIANGNLNALALALDLAVPPLTLLALVTAGVVLLSGFGAWLLGTYAPLCISVASLAVLAAAVLLCWALFARDILPAHALWSIVQYALRKLGIYSRLFSGRRVSRWTQTDRKK